MVKRVKFEDMEYTTTDSEEDSDYAPVLECEACAESYEVIEELTEKLEQSRNQIKNLNEELSKLRKAIIIIAEEIKKTIY